MSRVYEFSTRGAKAELTVVNPTVLLSELGLEQKGKVQKYLDKTVAKNLQPYVSFRKGTQEKSILKSLVAGSGEVHIDVDYAHYQAYSKRIHKRVGKRGTQPFERMVSDKRESILKSVTRYCSRVSK